MPDHLGIQLDVMGLFVAAMIAGTTNGHKTPPPGRLPSQTEPEQLAAASSRTTFAAKSANAPRPISTVRWL